MVAELLVLGADVVAVSVAAAEAHTSTLISVVRCSGAYVEDI